MKILPHRNSKYRIARCLAILSLLLAAPAIWTQQPAPAAIDGVDSVSITVSDMDRAVDFYSRVLKFEKVSESEVAGDSLEHLEGVFGARVHFVRLRLGEEFLELAEYLAPKGRPIPSEARSNDRSFQHVAIIVSDMDKAYRWLRENKVEHASTEPQRLPDWNKNAAGIWAFYFKDPDGHPLEILQFPPDKGMEKWHHEGGRLFLGIDHTAIVVGDTETSLRFYRDQLGMRIAGESVNYGTEQEHLNNVFGARLRITALRAAHGPGIELLEYLSPRDGRAFPPDEHANDIVHRQTILSSSDVEGVSRRLSSAGANYVSSGVVLNPLAGAGSHKAIIVRDPDGHAIEITER